MRYYGMSNRGSNMPNNQPAEPSNGYIEALPKAMPQSNVSPDYPNDAAADSDLEAAPQMSESQTFNRPNPATGIYQGQRAQNVRPIEDWIENLPPAVMPPGSNPSAMDFENATVYEYPHTRHG